MTKPIVLLAFLAILAVFCSTADAQVRYKDDEGVMHWVESMDQVPEKYRNSATGGPIQRKAPSSTPARPPSASQPPASQQPRSTAPPAPAPSAGAADPYREMNWHKNVINCTHETLEESGQYSKFATYIPAPGKVKIVGTASERFAFERCMSRAGTPTSEDR